MQCKYAKMPWTITKPVSDSDYWLLPKAPFVLLNSLGLKHCKKGVTNRIKALFKLELNWIRITDNITKKVLPIASEHCDWSFELPFARSFHPPLIYTLANLKQVAFLWRDPIFIYIWILSKTSSQSSVDAIDSWIANSWTTKIARTARRVSQKC